jgi:hypothetical protein
VASPLSFGSDAAKSPSFSDSMNAKCRVIARISGSAPIQPPNAALVNTISSFTKIHAFWSIKRV